MQLLISCIMMYDAVAVLSLTHHHFVTRVLACIISLLPDILIAFDHLIVAKANCEKFLSFLR